MAADQPADGRPDVTALLRRVVDQARRAPSLLNTQPWRWRIRDGVLRLYADRTRQVTSIDPRGRLLTLSCGAALHHARVALAAAGHEPLVSRHPDPGDPDLLAEVRPGRVQPPRWEDVHADRAIRQRRSDRRPFPATVPVPADTVAALHAAAEAERTWLYRVVPAQLPDLRAAARVAHQAQAADEDYLRELHAWTHRPRTSGEGTPPETFVAPVARPVQVRQFAPDGEILLDPGFGDDRHAAYLLVVTDGDEPADWLRAGEATSAVWLTATTRNLAVSVLSDVVEVAGARALLDGLLPRAGHPQLALRAGFDVQPAPPPASPRRRLEDVLDVESGRPGSDGRSA